MASFFNVGSLGNVFSSPVGQRIEKATDVSLPAEDWALNMEICDMVNESPDTARDAMKAIRKRLSQHAGKNNQVVMYTLTVLETCVKNCGKPFHVLVAQKDFIQDLVKLIGPKNDPPVAMQEKVLSLIQIWSDAFQNQPDLSGVTQMYLDLKNKGIEFPPTDLDSLAPIYTPQRSVPEQRATQIISPRHCMLPTAAPLMVSGPGAGPIALTAEQSGKLKSELDIVAENMSILSEMLSALKPGQEDPDDYVLLNELTSTCKAMQARIVDLIGRLSDDEMTAELLRINDELNSLFLRHQRYEKSRANNTNPSPSAVLGAALGMPDAIESADVLSNAASGVTPQKDQLLIDLIESSDQNNFSQLAIGGSGALSGAVDEFEALAQSRTDGAGNKTDLLRDIPTVDVATGSVGSPFNRSLGDPAVVSKVTKETEIDEIEAWLANSRETEGMEEITSSEFDKFLEERAAAADNLPTLSASENNVKKPPKKAAGDEDLLAL